VSPSFVPSRSERFESSQTSAWRRRLCLIEPSLHFRTFRVNRNGLGSNTNGERVAQVAPN
jgi:hypothetical protein